VPEDVAGKYIAAGQERVMAHRLAVEVCLALGEDDHAVEYGDAAFLAEGHPTSKPGDGTLVTAAWARAHAVTGTAAAAIEQIEARPEERVQGELLCILAEAVTEASGQAAGAEIVHRALDLARASKSPGTRASIRARSAVALAHVGEADAARELANDVVREAADHQEHWRYLLEDVIIARTELGDPDGALSAALDVARRVYDTTRRSSANDQSPPTIARALADHDMFQQATEFIAEVEDASLRVKALAEVAKSAAVAGDRDLAIATALRGLAALP
jgi:hypothetical protein